MKIPTLKEIEEQFGIIARWRWARKYGPLLIRAVRQYGIERPGFQSLFDAVDNMTEDQRIAADLDVAFDSMLHVPEPDADVSELLEGESRND